MAQEEKNGTTNSGCYFIILIRLNATNTNLSSSADCLSCPPLGPSMYVRLRENEWVYEFKWH